MGLPSLDDSRLSSSSKNTKPIAKSLGKRHVSHPVIKHRKMLHVMDSKSASDKFESLMDKLIVFCTEANIKLAINKLLQEFMVQYPEITGFGYRVLVNEDTSDVISPIINEVKDGKLSSEIGTSSHYSEEENRMAKLLNNLNSLKEIYNDPYLIFYKAFIFRANQSRTARKEDWSHCGPSTMFEACIKLEHDSSR